MSVIKQMPRVTYSESRTINIGDYESVQCMLNISEDVKCKFYGADGTMTISATKSKQMTFDKKRKAAKVKEVIGDVRSMLNEEETKIRKWAANMVTFESPEDKYPENRSW